MSDLNKEGQGKLLVIVDNPHSDYDESVDGHPNYFVYGDENGDFLNITLTTDDKSYDGTWRLTFVEGSVEDVEE